MLTVDEAQQRILKAFKPLGEEQVALTDALGRVLAHDVEALVDHPPMPVSAMDGYAVRARDVTDVPVTIPVIGESAAGHPFAGRIEACQAVRIFTGAVVPTGADAIVIQENTEHRDGDVVIKEPAPQGKFIRPVGMDFKTGAVLLKATKRLSGRDIALLAAMNHPNARVMTKPRVAVLSTGDEIVAPGGDLGPGQIPGSNGPGLTGLLSEWGAEVTDLGIVQDDRKALEKALKQAEGFDLLVTSGGASVGDHDLVKDVLGDLNFWKVAVRPGKPLMFGNAGKVPVIGLAGNPVSAMVGAVLFVKPAIERMLGLSGEQAVRKAVLASPLPANDRRQDYLRAVLHTDAEGRLQATPLNGQDSAMLAELARAEALIIRAPHASPASEGETVRIVVL